MTTELGPIRLSFHYEPSFEWAGAPVPGAGARPVEINGMLEWGEAKLLQELVANAARRVTVGDQVGILERISNTDDLRRDFNGWYLLQAVTISADQPHSLHDFVPVSIRGVLLGDRAPIITRSARPLDNDFDILARSVVVQPLEGEDAMGHPFVVDPGAGAGLVMAGHNATQGYGVSGGKNGLAGTGDIALTSGDVSLRAAIVPHKPDQNDGNLLTQWREPDQQAYALALHDDTIRLLWSTTGANTNTSQSAELGLTAGVGVLLRADLDVSLNKKIYMKKPLGRGSLRSQLFDETGWTTVSEDDDAGSTSIFGSGTGVKVGGYLDSNAESRSQFKGRILAAMLVDGLDTTTGVVRADPDFTIQPSGTTAFIDQAGVLWIVDNNEVTFIGSQPFDREYDPVAEYDPDMLTSLGRRLRLHQGKVA